MRDDTPDDLVHDLFAGALLPRPPARPRGARQRGHDQGDDASTTSPRTTARTTSRRTSCSRPPATSRTTRVVELIEARFPAADARRRPARDTRVPRDRNRLAVLRPRDRAGAPRARRARRCALLDPDRYALTVVNQVLGGGMSSRLFQEIREDARSRVLGVLVPRRASTTPGILAIYAGTAPERVAGDARRRSTTELARLVRDGPLRRRARRRRRAISPVRWRCRSRRRRAGCAASAARSWSKARSRPSTRSSAAIDAVTARRRRAA